MNKIICLSLFLKVSILFGQTKTYTLDMLFGGKSQTDLPFKKSPVCVGVGKDIDFKELFLFGYCKYESNFSDWQTFGIGMRFSFTNKYYIQNLHPFLDFYLPFYNLGSMSVKAGLGYVNKRYHKFGIGFGFSEEWKPFVNIDYRTTLQIKIKNKKKIKEYKCPNLS